jgi:hypothetical protein
MLRRRKSHGERSEQQKEFQEKTAKKHEGKKAGQKRKEKSE